LLDQVKDLGWEDASATNTRAPVCSAEELDFNGSGSKALLIRARVPLIERRGISDQNSRKLIAGELDIQGHGKIGLNRETITPILAIQLPVRGRQGLLLNREVSTRERRPGERAGMVLGRPVLRSEYGVIVPLYVNASDNNRAS
jgi:hypothetical protein